MWKLLLIAALGLFHGITPSDIENGNSGGHDGIFTNNSNAFPAEQSSDALDVTTPLSDSERKLKVAISVTNPEEIPSTPEGQRDIVKNHWKSKQLYENETEASVVSPESVLIGGLSKNSSGENEKIENGSSIYTKDSSQVTSEKIPVSSALISSLSENSSNENPTNESVRSLRTENILYASSEKNKVNSSVLEGEDLTIIGTDVANQSLVADLHSSRKDELITLDIKPTTSTSFASENSEDYLLVVTKDFKPLPPEKENFSSLDVDMAHRVKFTTTDDTPTISTFSTSENSESNLFATTIGKIDEDTDSTLTTQEKFFISESLDNDGQEINSSHPTVNESSLIYKNGNFESYSVVDTTGENTTYLVNAKDENTFVETSPDDISWNYTLSANSINTFVENSSLDSSPISLDKLEKNFSFIPEVFFSTHLSDTTLHNQSDSEEMPFVSTPDSSRQNISDYEPERTASPSSKQVLHQSYKLILTRDCSEDVISSQTFQSVSEIFNSRLNTQNRTEFMKCVSVYEFNFTSDIASEESFNDIVHLIQETIDSNMEASIVDHDSIVHHIPSTRRVDTENFVVPKLVVYITTASTIVIITFMIFVVLILRKRCKKSSSSLDLSDIPHIALSVDDFKVAPIPRPSVSFPESNRDFLYAYSNETYNRTKDESMIQRHFPKVVGKEIEAAKMQKAASLALEMQTFTRNGGEIRNRSDSKSTPDYEFASAGYWDRLRGREVAKKQGLDNPAMKW